MAGRVGPGGALLVAAALALVAAGDRGLATVDAPPDLAAPATPTSTTTTSSTTAATSSTEVPATTVVVPIDAAPVAPPPTTTPPPRSSPPPAAIATPPTTPPVPAPSGAAAALLVANAPGATHDARPHGVPPGYDWASRAVVHRIEPPASNSGYVNMWGQIFVDESDYHAPNTRVAIGGCELWRLPPAGSPWEQLQPEAPTDGGAWSEDFRRNGGPFDIRDEPDGSQSMVPAPGWNAHFWTEAPLAYAGGGSRAFVAACSARLVLADPGGVDDRASSRYLVSLGADWRRSDHGCPTDGGITVCHAIGIGRFVRVAPTWQRLVFSTIDAAAVGTVPALPAEVFANPP